MRAFLIIAAFAILCTFVPTSKAVTLPAVVHHCAAHNTSSTTVTCTWVGGGNSTTNNRIIIACMGFPSTFSGYTLTASDSSSNSYVQDSGSSITQDSTGGGGIQTSSANITSGGGGVITPKCTGSATSSTSGIMAVEVSGLPTSSAVDSHANGAPDPAALVMFAAATNTSTAANTFVYTACESENNILIETGPGNVTIDGDAVFDADEYALYFGAGSQVPTMTNGASTDHDACNVVAYKFSDQTAVTSVIPFNGGGINFGGSSSTTWSWTHVVGSGSNRLLVVFLGYGNSVDSAVTVKLDGSTNFTRMIQQADNGSNFFSGEVWTLVAPSSGSHTINVTYNSARFGFGLSTDLANVNQTTPTAGLQSTAGSLATTTLTVTSATNDLVLTYSELDAAPLCLGSPGISDFNNNWSGNDLPSVSSGHFAGAASVSSTTTQITGGFPTVPTPVSCPGTAIGSPQDEIQVAFDVQNQPPAIPQPGSLIGGASKFGGPTVIH